VADDTVNIAGLYQAAQGRQLVKLVALGGELDGAGFDNFTYFWRYSTIDRPHPLEKRGNLPCPLPRSEEGANQERHSTRPFYFFLAGAALPLTPPLGFLTFFLPLLPIITSCLIELSISLYQNIVISDTTACPPVLELIK